MYLPTRKALCDQFGTRKGSRLHKILDADTVETDRQLELCDRVLGHCGVEAVMQDGWRPIALYTNSGDTYDPCILYDIVKDDRTEKEIEK